MARKVERKRTEAGLQQKKKLRMTHCEMRGQATACQCPWLIRVHLRHHRARLHHAALCSASHWMTSLVPMVVAQALHLNHRHSSQSSAVDAADASGMAELSSQASCSATSSSKSRAYASLACSRA